MASEAVAEKSPMPHDSLQFTMRGRRGCACPSRRRCVVLCLATCLTFVVVLGAAALYVWYEVLEAEDIDYDLDDLPFTERRIFIQANELEELLASERGATVLDARTRYHPIAERLRPGYGDSIGGAYGAEWSDFTETGGRGHLASIAEIEQRFRDRGVSNDVPVVVFGSWKEEWGEEGRIFWQLDWLNHTQAYILYGGIFAWADGGFEGRGRQSAGDFVARPVAGRYVTAEDVHARLRRHSDITIIDARSSDEYDGSTPHGSERGGHIPTARHYDWRWVFDPDDSGNLKPIANLTSELAALGVVDEDEEIIVYCTSGVRAAFLYAVLQWLGFENVANYASSWYMWSRDDRLPVESV